MNVSFRHERNYFISKWEDYVQELEFVINNIWASIFSKKTCEEKFTGNPVPDQKDIPTGICLNLGWGFCFAV